ncbi:DEBR0S6_04060g1_1 [Brettanomyces bruxellensis]|uniref:DEBR0S6_04060g1_1 n=1 Tax=Dekkera bruxellensis TaxID=5007 RepID=A0A7D9H562_DEKBR|nr:DEBR0S6_04060g1_1 [Brettanomyces bruxellensis]
MDIDYSHGSPKRGYFTYAKTGINRLSKKVKLLLLGIIIFILYWIFIRRADKGLEKGNALFQGTSNQFDPNQSSITDEKISRIHLNYLDLKKPFVDLSTLKFNNYVNGGNMQIERDSDHVCLVPDRSSALGYLFSKSFISESDSSALEVELDFRIHGHEKRSNLIGDGMALWFTDSQLHQGDVFGVQSDYKGLGIFIDTYKNGDRKEYKSMNKRGFPYISIQPNYGNAGQYNKDNDGYQTELDGCSIHRVYDAGNQGKISKIRVIFLRKKAYFRLDVDINGDGSWQNCIQKMNFPVDAFPLKPYIGLSAETGQLTHAVDIYRLQTSTFRASNGEEIKNVHSLLNSIGVSKNQQSKSTQRVSEKRNKNGLRSMKRRRTFSRLQRQEKELKRKDEEKYGSKYGFLGWFGSLVWKTLKVIMCSILIIFIGYFGFLAFRVFRDKRRDRAPRGLL